MRCSQVLFAVAMCAGSVEAIAGGSCSYQVNLVEVFDAIGNPALGQTQRESDAWTFRRTDQSNGLLTGVLVAGVGGWGAPDQAYLVPLVGPRYSPNPDRNQIGFYYRAPSFEGLMCHPGFGSVMCEVAVTPQTNVLLTGVTLKAELLGQFSPDAIVKLMTTSGTTDTTLFPALSIARLAAATTLTQANSSVALPISIGSGTSLRMLVANGGDAAEDWLNAQLTITIEGPPMIARQPRDIIISGPSTGSFEIFAPGATEYRWYRGTDQLFDGVAATGAYINGTTTAKLEIYNPFFDDAGGGYHCVVGNACGSVTSASAVLSICPSDFDADGFITFNDFDAFVTSFDAGEAAADFNRDGFLTFEDFDSFVSAFEAGC